MEVDDVVRMVEVCNGGTVVYAVGQTFDVEHFNDEDGEVVGEWAVVGSR